MTSADSSYKGFRYPKEIISHAVWLYHRFALSLRDVQELMFERGVVVSHETIRQWCAKFGQSYVFSTLTPRFSVIRAMTTLLSRADILGCHIDGGVPTTLDRLRHLHIGRTTYTHTRVWVWRFGSQLRVATEHPRTPGFSDKFICVLRHSPGAWAMSPKPFA